SDGFSQFGFAAHLTFSHPQKLRTEESLFQFHILPPNVLGHFSDRELMLIYHSWGVVNERLHQFNSGHTSVRCSQKTSPMKDGEDNGTTWQGVFGHRGNKWYWRKNGSDVCHAWSSCCRRRANPTEQFIRNA